MRLKEGRKVNDWQWIDTSRQNELASVEDLVQVDRKEPLRWAKRKKADPKCGRGPDPLRQHVWWCCRLRSSGQGCSKVTMCSRWADRLATSNPIWSNERAKGRVSDRMNPETYSGSVRVPVRSKTGCGEWGKRVISLRERADFDWDDEKERCEVMKGVSLFQQLKLFAMATF